MHNIKSYLQYHILSNAIKMIYNILFEQMKSKSKRKKKKDPTKTLDKDMAH